MVYKPVSFDNLLYIALVAMVLDHLAFVFPSHSDTLRAIGRIAFPFFAWSLGANLAKRSSVPWQMLGRMHTTGFLCIGLWLAIAPGLDVLNIFYTLMLSVLTIAALETSWGMRVEHKAAVWCLVLYGAPLVDYGAAGVLLPIGFYAWYRQPSLRSFQWVCALLGWLSVAYSPPMAWVALPLGAVLVQIPRTIARPHPGIFYYAYAGHLFAIALYLVLARALM